MPGKMKGRRIPAFTLMEIAIAMLISALLIGMTYTIYSIVARSFAAFTKKNNAIAMISRLDELLKKDFDRADRIEKTENGIAMTRNGQSVIYTISPGALLRTAGITDTFKIAVISSTASFEGRAIAASTPDAESSRIDDFDMLFVAENDTLTGHYHKTYSSANLINRNAHAVN
jgi:hypothetical protein